MLSLITNETFFTEKCSHLVMHCANQNRRMIEIPYKTVVLNEVRQNMLNKVAESGEKVRSNHRMNATTFFVIMKAP